MSRQPLLLWLPLMFALGKGTLFDFHVIPTRQSYQSGESLCRGLGYDGLAIISSPEMYRYALQLTKPLRTNDQTCGVYVGLRRNSVETHLMTWDDGSSFAEDTPWLVDISLYPQLDYGVLNRAGDLTLSSGTWGQYSLCGNHNNLPTEAQGITAVGQQPDSVSSSLSVIKVPSYMECVLLCGRDCRCRAAEFNSNLLTCMILSPGSYTGLKASGQSQTFVRNGYI
ncbi:hypothetical protein RRG08_042862 [Elysia crispata]|uniref:Apple domain-containing protein n=1 Tax=Elysia crispata TaxID=231223 RepID=A0AAE1AIA0_9GAST|nr:hypothetical protein RRG08_042862 [Elysia crispata]